MPRLSSYYQDKLNELDRMLDTKYNDPNAPTAGEEAKERQTALYAEIKAGKVLAYPEDPIAEQKLAHRTWAKKLPKTLFKKKGFYYRITDNEEAVIFAARAKDPTAPLTVPKRLGRHPVVGVCDFSLYTGSGYGKYRSVAFTERPQGKKPALYGILSFPNLKGHEALPETQLCDNAEEVTVAPTVERLLTAVLPCARVLRLPSTLTYLGPLYAPMLQRIEICDHGAPAKECVLSPGAFSICEQLTHLALPLGVKQLPDGLLCAVNHLKYLHIPTGVEDIGQKLLSHIESLEELRVDGLISKGSTPLHAERASIYAGSLRCFGGDVRHLTLTGSPTSLYEVPVKVEELTLPDSIRTLCQRALAEQKELKRLTLPAGLTTVSAFAFSGSGLTEIALPGGVQEIEPRAFANCKALSSVQLPAALKKLDSRAFAGCTALRSLTLPDDLAELRCRTVTAQKRVRLDIGRELVLSDLRPLGAADAADALQHVELIAKEGTPAAAALETYRARLHENIAENRSAIEAYLYADGKLTVTNENIDHVTAAIRYLSAVDPEDNTLLTGLTTALADFFLQLMAQTDAEADFDHANYFYDTLKHLKLHGARAAYDTLKQCGLVLLDRIAASTKHTLLGEKLLAEGTPKAREDALRELVSAYRIYPRSAPTLMALIHWFASDPQLYDTTAPDKFLELVKQCQGDDDIETDYTAKATEMLNTLRESHKSRFYPKLSEEDKRQLYWKDLAQDVAQRSAICPDPTPITVTEKDVRDGLKRPRHLSFRIDEAFFASVRREVEKRLTSSFDSTVEGGEAARERKLFAIDEAEATLYPQKRAGVKKRKDKWLSEQKKQTASLFSMMHPAPAPTQATYADSTASVSYSSASDTSDYAYSPYSSQYPYTYDNPYSPVTETASWAHAEAVAIEWDIIDRDYYMDLGIFGDHSL